jgi:hypothetical protein
MSDDTETDEEATEEQEGGEPDEPEEVETAEPESDEIGEGSEADGEDIEYGCEACETPESEMLVTYDRNKDYPWKSGNPYCRICPECGSRTFTARSYWESQEVRYVIPKSESDPQPLYGCPYEDCGATFVGEVGECPTCERAIEWEETE